MCFKYLINTYIVKKIVQCACTWEKCKLFTAHTDSKKGEVKTKIPPNVILFKKKYLKSMINPMHQWVIK